MYHLTYHSLAEVLSRPVFCKRDVGRASTKEIGPLIHYFLKSKEAIPVEVEALRFYLCNDFLAKLSQRYDRNTPLPGNVYEQADTAVHWVNKAAERLVYYTLLIITRESRHAKSGLGLASVHNSFGPKYAAFQSQLASLGSNGSAELFMNSPPDMELGEYVKACEKLFREAHFGSSFGGKPWADIANALYRCVTGELSLELFADIAFALCHNNGPMFNKGMMYSMTEPLVILKILDVQRSGQIPNLIASDNTISDYVATGAVTSLFKKFNDVIGPEYSAPVDWKKVDALGAVGGPYAQEAVSKVDVVKALFSTSADASSMVFVKPHKGVEKIKAKREKNGSGDEAEYEMVEMEVEVIKNLAENIAESDD